MSFTKGTSGNPNGRPPKTQSMTELLETYGNGPMTGPRLDGITRKQALSMKLWSLAFEGDMAAIKYIFDRIDGKPANSIREGNEDVGGLNIIVQTVTDNSNVEIHIPDEQ